jgi:HPt (histidine-containing phosphotransfer) domain-containing protein
MPANDDIGRANFEFAAMSAAMDRETTPSGPILDLEAALTRLGGDRELFAEMVGFLLEDVPKLFDELRAAVTRNDAPAVRMKAHALKGLVAGCGGVRAMTVAQALEDAGHTGNLRQASRLLPALQAELNLLTQALANHPG